MARYLRLLMLIRFVSGVVGVFCVCACMSVSICDMCFSCSLLVSGCCCGMRLRVKGIACHRVAGHESDLTRGNKEFYQAYIFNTHSFINGNGCL